MQLIEFLKKYKITRTKFSKDCNISTGTLWNCLKSTQHTTSQRVAVIIEEYTKGLVTVKELRSTDDREPFNPNNIKG